MAKKTLAKRFYTYKYSGPIVFVPLAIVLIGFFVYIYTGVEFFEVWSCDTIKDYLLDKDVPKDIIPHNELTETQHDKLHTIYQECIDNQRFANPINHEGIT